MIKKLLSLTVCLVLSCISLSNSVQLSYDDVHLRSLNCYPTDTCQNIQVETASRNVRLLENFDKRACNCDDRCLEYQDCCVDAKALTAKASEGIFYHQNNGQVCKYFRNYGGVYIVNKCVDDWDDAEVKSKCEESDPITDPMADVPVSDSVEGTTYKNSYCALCNRKASNNVTTWKIRFECFGSHYDRETKDSEVGNMTEEFVIRNIVYNDTEKFWGVKLGSRFVSCEINPFMPDNIGHRVRRCREMTTECSPDWKDEVVRDRCKYYTAAVTIYDNPQNLFKNVHCALCNGFTIDDITCGTIGVTVNSRHWGSPSFHNTPFTLILDFNSNDGQYVGTVSRCEDGKIFDPFFKFCRDLTCGSDNYHLKDGKCIRIIDDNAVDNVNSRMGFAFSNPNNFTGKNISNDTDPSFSECPKLRIDTKNVLRLENGSVYILTYYKMFEVGQFEFTNDSHVLICAFDIQEETAKFSPYMTYISFIGLGISLLCLFLHFIAFLIVPDLQNLSGKNLCSLVVALFVAYTSFIVGAFGDRESLQCLIVSILTYYSFLAVFFWMNVISFDVWQTLKMATTELRVSSGKRFRKYICYSLYAWGMPGICVLITLLLDYEIIEAPMEYAPSFGTRNCWFGNRVALAILFGIPTGTLLFFNIIFFLLSTHMILWSTRKSSSFSSPSSSSKRNYKLYLRLAVICGLTWIWGFLAGLFNVEPLWYIFIFFNTLIGFFIFITFTCTKKVKSSLKEKFKCFAEQSGRQDPLNISASSNSNLNSNDTRKSTLIPSESADSTNSSERFNGIYNPIAAYRTN